MIRKILSLMLLLTALISAQGMDQWIMRSNVYSIFDVNFVFAQSLNGLNEFSSVPDPVNLDLNDTNRVVLDIDNDLELSEELTNNNFTSDITGWLGNASGVYHYDSDWNSIGRTNVLQDSATATSSVFVYQLQTFTAGIVYRITYDYYIPSVNTTIAGVKVGSNAEYYEASLNNTLDAWTSVSITFTATGNGTSFRFYPLDAAGANNMTVGDLIYFDNIYVTAYPNYTATGNHSFDSTSVNPLTGSYSGLITSSGTGDSVYVFLGTQGKGWDITTSTQTLVFNFEANANDDYIRIYFSDTGDSTTNYVELSETNYEPMVAGEKYTLQFQMEGTSDVANDTIRIDEVDLSEAYDMTFMAWIKSSDVTSNDYIVALKQGSDYYWTLVITSSKVWVYAQDISVKNVVISLNEWVLVSLRIDRTGNITLGIDASYAVTDATGIKRYTSNLLNIGAHVGNVNPFVGYIGETKIDIANNADMSEAEILTAYKRGRAGKHFLETGNEVAWYKWAGNNNTDFLSDETGNNDLTGINVTQSDDQIKLKKYKD